MAIQSGGYISQVIRSQDDISMWDRLIYKGVTKDATIRCFTRSSHDALNWTGWALVKDWSIKSPPRPFLQYKIEVEFEDSLFPTIEEITITYVRETLQKVRIRSNHSDWLRHQYSYIEGDYDKARIRSDKSSSWLIVTKQ